MDDEETMLTPAAKRAFVKSVLKRRQRPMFANAMEEFFVNGFVGRGFQSGETLSAVLRILRELFEGEVRAPFFFEEKSPKYFLLRPGAASYSTAFEDLIFENHVPELLEHLAGSRLYLGQIVVLKHLPGITVNTEWHRDTHFLSGRLTGPMPPAIKVYFYPSFGPPPLPRIKFIAGSNRIDFRSPLIEQLHAVTAKATTVHNSDDQFVVFDTTTLHQAIPDKDARGSMRLLYQFYRVKQQIDERHGPEAELHSRYMKRAGMV